jgi:hypothetical protein
MEAADARQRADAILAEARRRAAIKAATDKDDTATKPR